MDAPSSYSSGNVAGFLLAGKDPRKTALILPGASHSYGELDRASARVAGHLVELGCRKTDRVALLAENSFFWVAAYLGTLRAGMVAVPLPPGIAPGDLDHVLRSSDARVVFSEIAPAGKHAASLRHVRIVTDRDLPNLSEPPATPLTCAHRDDLAALMFTSGSTARSRGVMISHGNIIANTESILSYLELCAADRMMTVLPFHYCFGTSLLHTHLRAGGDLVIEPRFMYPELVLERMIETNCTGLAGVPSHFQILLRNSRLGSMSFPHLRCIQQAGGHLAPVFISKLRQALPQVRIFIMYGQTEATARLSYLPPDLLDTRPGSIGKGIPGVKLRVLKPNGEDVQPGETGEIVAEGANVALGYWRNPEESAAAFRHGRLHTGDLATVDSDGFIYVVDRAGDFVKCGGRRVSCRQLEDILLSSEDLIEAAVIGVPDDVLGEAVKAFVVLRKTDSNGVGPRLRAFCKAQMPAPLVPREIVVLPALPKNAAGKVLKPRLKTL